jgi:tetratricopeptide (TPR) repeat protein
LGNSAATIVRLQSLLRSDPTNKRTWDLTIQAYQLLEQPQRVKIAYQNYLKFFPTEPAAMFGLISSITAENNLAKALELLDQYEAALFSAGYLDQLKQIYTSLDKIDPLNIRVLKGLIRVATAACNEDEVQSLTSKLQSLHSVSGAAQRGSTGQESTHVFAEEHSLGAVEAIGVSSLGEPPSEQTIIPGPENIETKPAPSFVSVAEPSDLTIDALMQPEEEIEIDIDIDIDSPCGTPDQKTDDAPADDNWLDSVGDLFDTIDTAPRGVKFGNEMEGSDAQSHFDLGQAFKEMGLYDEAINEFRQASHDASRRVECLIMQCACLRERGELEKSTTMLLALLKPGLSLEESCAVKYELASGYEAAGKIEEAHLLLCEINATNPGFRDISSRINAANLSDSLDFSDDDLKDF